MEVLLEKRVGWNQPPKDLTWSHPLGLEIDLASTLTPKTKAMSPDPLCPLDQPHAYGIRREVRGIVIAEWPN